MEIKYYGANCIKIITKKATLVIDDTLVANGKKSITTNKDISINTNRELEYSNSDYFVIDSSGEYELSEISIHGIDSKLHYDPSKKNTMYSIHSNGLSVAVLGHTEADLSDKQIESFGIVDILIIPIGGSGFTIDSVEAIKLIKTIEPKIVIPTHYKSDTVKYEVPQQPLEEFVKTVGSGEIENVDVLKIKDNNIPEKTRFVVLKEQ